MSVIAKATASRSRSLKSVIGGIAVVGASALVLSGCAAPEEPAGPVEELTLKIGTLLPQTGTLAFLGPPEEAGVGLAAAEINEADLGITVEVVYGDSGDLTNQAYVTEAPRLLSEGVSAIIGAASSGVSLQFIDQVIDAGTILFSPANTSAAFTTYDDNDLYWRTAPSDVLQGEVLGNLIAEDGHQTLGLIVLNDSYGTGLAEFTTEAFEAAGGTVVAAPTFNSGDTNFDAQVAELVAAAPDAIAVISFDEYSTIVPALLGAGIPGANLYFVDGNLAQFGDEFAPGALAGAKGTLPGLSVDDIADFTDQADEFWQSEGNAPLEEFSYAAESYDAVILLALAALAAGSTDAADIAAYLQEVSGGSGDGTKYSSFADAGAAILAGETVDYDGPSGPITFNEVGDPTEASIGIYVFGDDNRYTAYTG